MPGQRSEVGSYRGRGVGFDGPFDPLTERNRRSPSINSLRPLIASSFTSIVGGGHCAPYGTYPDRRRWGGQ
jgi:hypothetical protein